MSNNNETVEMGVLFTSWGFADLIPTFQCTCLIILKELKHNLTRFDAAACYIFILLYHMIVKINRTKILKKV